MKRIYLYDRRGAICWSGNLCDLPLDGEAVAKEARRLYGERVCNDRLSNVKQLLRAKILACGEVLSADAVLLLRDRNAVRFVVTDD